MRKQQQATAVPRSSRELQDIPPLPPEMLSRFPFMADYARRMSEAWDCLRDQLRDMELALNAVRQKANTTVTLTTSDIPEGTNLYWTEARARAITGTQTGSTPTPDPAEDFLIASNIIAPDVVLTVAENYTMIAPLSLDVNGILNVEGSLVTGDY